jgi:hypothetical protein
MKMKSRAAVIMLNFNVITALLFGLTTNAAAWTKGSLPPGSYFNPMMVQQAPNGTTEIRPKYYPGGDPTAPGNVYNPYIVERNGDSVEIRPKYVWPSVDKEDNE